MSVPDLKTCRFCGMSNFDYEHPAVKSAWVKYSTRHSCHLQCAIEKQGAAFLEKLTLWQIENLPFMEIRKLGLEQDVRRIVDSRSKPVEVSR